VYPRLESTAQRELRSEYFVLREEQEEQADRYAQAGQNLGVPVGLCEGAGVTSAIAQSEKTPEYVPCAMM